MPILRSVNVLRRVAVSLLLPCSNWAEAALNVPFQPTGKAAVATKGEDVGVGVGLGVGTGASAAAIAAYSAACSAAGLKAANSWANVKLLPSMREIVINACP